jgi:Secretion system C-terminal sorting domain
MRPLLLLLWLLQAFTPLPAQNQDCATAFTVCGLGSTHFNFPIGTNSSDSGVNGTCISSEMNSTWIVWTIIQGGWMTFTLSPDSSYQDLNFVLYKIPGIDDCINKVKIRCMASGENIGEPFSTWQACTGDTGIAAGQSDTEEGPGCSSGANNLLAAQVAENGDHYLLLVNNSNFSSGGNAAGFSIQFGGAVILDCSNVVSEGHNFAITNSCCSLHPNPSKGFSWLTIEEEELRGADVTIYNLFGQVVFSKPHILDKRTLLDLTRLSDGNYLLQLRKEARVVSSRFVLLAGY